MGVNQPAHESLLNRRLSSVSYLAHLHQFAPGKAGTISMEQKLDNDHENRLLKMRQTLARLLAEPLDHVIVVENGSTDGTREWLASLNDTRLDVITMPDNGGGALGFETGMRHVTAQYDPDWMVLMDGDGRPKSGAIARFQEGIIERRWLQAEALASAWR